MQDSGRISRRGFCLGLLAAGAAPGLAQAQAAKTDVTFVFAADIHACRMASGLSPNCAEEGKTDENLLRHIAALNRLEAHHWPGDRWRWRPG